MEIKLSPLVFKELILKGYSLDGIYLLLMLKEGYIIEETFGDIPKLTNIGQSLIRKGLVTEEGKITLEGEELLKFLPSNVDSPKLIKKRSSDDPFKEFWSVFPSTDTFVYKGRKFNGTRALKTKKEECKAKLNKILSEGEYTIKDIVEALKIEIYQKKESSFKTGQNKLSYVQNSLTWLNQRGFEAFIELYKTGHKIEEESKIDTYDGINI